MSFNCKGQLVDIDTDSGWRWRTSLSRDDTGGGSCEIVYLQDIVVEERGLKPNSPLIPNLISKPVLEHDWRVVFSPGAL